MEPQRDLDLVLTCDAVHWASTLARRVQGGFVVLDRDRQIARVVLESGTIDVALQVGDSIEADLHQRDFTCNAIAYDLKGDRWIDPLNGRQAIRDRQLQVVHPDNLTADPLRLLRGYRQAAQLGFTLAPDTRAEIVQRRQLLRNVAGERVRAELGYLLDLGTVGLDWLEQAEENGVLADWLPNLTPASFTRTRQLWTSWQPFANQFPVAAQHLLTPLSDRRTGLVTTILAVLLSHLDLERVEQCLLQMKYSRAEQRWVQKVLTLVPKFTELVAGKSKRSQEYQLFAAAGNGFPGVALAVFATHANGDRLAASIRCYEDPSDPLAHQVPLVGGTELMRALQLKPGPLVGQLLAQLHLAQADGEIATAAEAIAWGRQWLARQQQGD
jgi:tRNA nucleotidyltransferase (CCA-adding enzyme)